MDALRMALERRIYTVTQLTARIREALNRQFGNVWVDGEISGVKAASSGHIYFTLKDAGAQVRCVCFKSSMRLLRFQPRDGMAVVARGRVDVYEARGEYQMIVEVIEPRGAGALQAAFEQLKERLEREGLFAAERKRALPFLPRRIGVVTSPAGAVIRDILHVMERRCPGVHVMLYPALVQGDGAAATVAAGLEWFAGSGWPDVVIVARGGGSLEDLWAFNDEAVARAIAASPVPVISAVGHETDFTIADFVADLRAPTPSAAAELAVPDLEGLEARLDSVTARLARAAELRIARAAQRLDDLDSRVDRNGARVRERSRRLLGLETRLRQQSPQARLARARERGRALEQRLDRAVRARLSAAARRLEPAGRLPRLVDGRLAGFRRRLDPAAAALESLSPLRVLERGYAIVQTGDGAALRDAADAPVGTRLRIRVRRGDLVARVEEDGGEAPPS